MPKSVRESLVLLHDDAVRLGKMDLAAIYRSSVLKIDEDKMEKYRQAFIDFVRRNKDA